MRGPFQTILRPTADGSLTLEVPALGETYHSVHGACTESRHVFIQHGLMPFLSHPIGRPVAILEVGFGTGLNFLLTALALRTFPQAAVRYEAVEPFPPDYDALKAAGFYRIPCLNTPFFEEAEPVSFDRVAHKEGFQDFRIRNESWPCPLPDAGFDLIYYDAFAPSRQPEMWTQEALEAAWRCLKPGGLWVTYAAQGAMRRTLCQIGFVVERLPGPPGKREMTKAMKP